VWTAVEPTVPGAPTITAFFDNGFNWNIQFLPPESDGDSPLTGYNIYLDDVLSTPDSTQYNFNGESLAQFSSFLGDATLTVSAVNAVGEGPVSAPQTAPYPE
jgi:hypothetical protein